jgi:hypothetical protein
LDFLSQQQEERKQQESNVRLDCLETCKTPDPQTRRNQQQKRADEEEDHCIPQEIEVTLKKNVPLTAFTTFFDERSQQGTNIKNMKMNGPHEPTPRNPKLDSVFQSATFSCTATRQSAPSKDPISTLELENMVMRWNRLELAKMKEFLRHGNTDFSEESSPTGTMFSYEFDSMQDDIIEKKNHITYQASMELTPRSKQQQVLQSSDLEQ